MYGSRGTGRRVNSTGRVSGTLTWRLRSDPRVHDASLRADTVSSLHPATPLRTPAERSHRTRPRYLTVHRWSPQHTTSAPSTNLTL